MSKVIWELQTEGCSLGTEEGVQWVEISVKNLRVEKWVEIKGSRERMS